MSIVFQGISPTDLLICCAIVYVAAIVQMSVGMGFGMLASPLIALVKPEIVPVSVLAIGLVVAISGAWREKQHIKLNELKFGVGGRVIGSVLAILVMSQISRLDVFLILFGVVMLVAVALTASGLRLKFTERNLLGLSVLSGLMGTITAVGAPPMALIYHTRPPHIVRPTLNAFFASACMLGLGGLWASGWVDVEALVFAAFMLPAMLLGIASSRAFMRLPGAHVSRALLALSATASILLIMQGLD